MAPMVKLRQKLVITLATRLHKMPTDNTKLNYLSTWDIDKLLVEAQETIIGSGTTALYTIPASLPVVPTYEVQFKVSPTTLWCQTGTYGTGGSDYFSTYVQSGVIYIKTTTAGTARLYVWTDKVDY